MKCWLICTIRFKTLLYYLLVISFLIDTKRFNQLCERVVKGGFSSKRQGVS